MRILPNIDFLCCNSSFLMTHKAHKPQSKRETSITLEHIQHLLAIDLVKDR